MYSRRDFTKLTLSSLALSLVPRAGWPLQNQAAPLDTTVRGVKLGVITGGFGGGRGQGAAPPAGDPADAIIHDLREIGAANIELSANLYGAPALVGGAVGGQTPAPLTPEYVRSREALRQWRLTAPLDRFREVRQKFAAA